MSIHVSPETVYPESDDEPMAETSLYYLKLPRIQFVDLRHEKIARLRGESAARRRRQPG
jgi:hypothetical protein